MTDNNGDLAHVGCVRSFMSNSCFVY